MNPITFLVDQLMLPILSTFHNVTHSYGWAIVFLTFIIKMVLLPLTVQSYNSMKEMQKLQPKLKQLQERYRKRPEELNKKMMELYREHKVNPLGGCLPMLIQMPFLIALYAALMSEKFKTMLVDSGDTSFLILENLAKVGVYSDSVLNIDNLLLVLFFGATTFLQQKFMSPSPPPGGDPRQAAMQKQMAVMMPIMITLMFLFFPVPTGVYVYLVVSNLIGIAQYAYLHNQGDKLAPATAMGSTSSEPAVIEVEADDADLNPTKFKKKNYKKKKKRK